MSKFWAVAKREYLQVVKKKSFIIGIFLTPAIMAAFMLLPAYLAQKKATSSEHLAVIDNSGTNLGERFVESLKQYKLEDSDEPYYVVDSLYQIAPDNTEQFTAIDDSLRTAVNDKELKYFLVIKQNPQEADSNLYLVTNSDNFRSINRFEYRLTMLISSMRLEETNINLPVDSVLKLTKEISLRLQDTKGEAIPFQVKYFGALIFVMIIYVMILTYGLTVMRSVIEEKTSRIMEVLVSSISPFQLMLGKITGLGAATFTQFAIWLIIGGAIFFTSAATQLDTGSAIARLVFNPVIIVFFGLFMLFGYILYSTIYALVGSIVNDEKEAQVFQFPIILCLILPVIIGIYVVQEPYSPLALILSFIPLFTPTMMMMRIIFLAPTATEYSFFSGILGEATLAFIILVIATIFIIWLTGKIFRVGILMYGKRPTLPELIKWIKY